MAGVIPFYPVYHRRGYVEVIDRYTEECMLRAITEVRGLSHYSTQGEVSIVYTSTSPLNATTFVLDGKVIVYSTF